jgi:hypothetical protein
VGGGEEESVVGADQHRSGFAHLDGHRATGGTDPRVHDRQYYRIAQPGGVSPEGEGPRANVVRADPVGEVDHRHARGDGLDDPVDDSDELVVEAVVAKE